VRDLVLKMAEQKYVSLLTSHISRSESRKSETATQQTVNQWKEQVRGLPAGRYKSWQVLSMDYGTSQIPPVRVGSV